MTVPSDYLSNEQSIIKMKALEVQEFSGGPGRCIDLCIINQELDPIWEHNLTAG